MKTFFQFLNEIYEKEKQYENERRRRSRQTPEEKERDPVINKLSRLLNREIYR